MEGELDLELGLIQACSCDQVCGITLIYDNGVGHSTATLKSE
jgi:hypothetical protein